VIITNIINNINRLSYDPIEKVAGDHSG